MCHLLFSYWASVKCPNFAALSCCVFISMYASAACWLRSLYILSLDLALCIFCRCCAWCVASMHGSCLLRTSYSPYVFWLCIRRPLLTRSPFVWCCWFSPVFSILSCVLYLLIVLYCTLFCCCTRYSLFSCVVIVFLCRHFGVWLVCSFWLVSLRFFFGECFLLSFLKVLRNWDVVKIILFWVIVFVNFGQSCARPVEKF